jgi:hypothetical protein
MSLAGLSTLFVVCPLQTAPDELQSILVQTSLKTASQDLIFFFFFFFFFLWFARDTPRENNRGTMMKVDGLNFMKKRGGRGQTMERETGEWGTEIRRRGNLSIRELEFGEKP